MKARIFLLSLITLTFGCEPSKDVGDGLNKSNQLAMNESFAYRTDGLGEGDYNPDDYYGTDRYNELIENPFIKTSEQNVSTFSIDADGASYSNVRRFIEDGFDPPKNAIRTEEMINYFVYDYPEPEAGETIGLNGEICTCPWNEEHQLIRIGIKGKTIAPGDLPPANIVLLVDVSGSMSSPGKLELLKESFSSLVSQFREQDRIAIVTYAGNAGVALNSTPGNEKDKIMNVINNLESGGSTAGAEGIITAYEIAVENFVENGNNRIILATDGDFNVGPSSQEELVELIEEKRESGIFLTVLGVGYGNLNDALMEQTANNGNGTYEYIDTYEQAQKVFTAEYGKFYSVAKDVKIQVEFDPEKVSAYRLIGYENRLLEEEDFEDDTKDAGEIGSGQTITALYEIIPTNNSGSGKSVTIDFRYKFSNENTSKSLSMDILDEGKDFNSSSESMRFASSVAAFAMVLRDSEYKGNASFTKVADWAKNSKSFDPYHYREHYIDLVYKVLD